MKKEIKDMRRGIDYLTGCIAAVFLLALIVKPDCAAAREITLNYANFPPASTFPCVQMERWKKEVEKRTRGKVSIRTYPGGSLLSAKNMMDGVIAGQADIGCLCTAYQPGRFILTNATALPFGFRDATTGSLVLWDLYEKYRPGEFNGVKVLTMFTCAPASIYSRKPVRTLEDLSGMELRASGGAARFLKALGAVPVGMPQSETPEALQKGVVKGAASSLEALKDFKYAEICRYATLFNGPVYPFAVVMNIRKWESLPQEVRDVMEDLGREQALWTGKYMDDHVKESIDWAMKEHSLQVIELAAEEKARWDELLEPITDQWVKEARERGLPAEAILEDIRALAERHSR